MSKSDSGTQRLTKPTTLWQVMLDECGVLLQLRKGEKVECQRNDQAEPAEKQLAAQVCKAMADQGFSALCLSGGGIRSATFCLGVIQAFARCKIKDKDGNPGSSLFEQFDYLSTVSGGGYIGSWLSAWIHHEGGNAREVVEALTQRGESKLDPEAPPVEFLRQYSNYLNPKLGFTSADTWSLVATVLRNVLLNWIVLLPFVAAILVLPVLFSATLKAGVSSSDHKYPFGTLAVFFGAFAFVYMSLALPANEVENPKQHWFIYLCLLPTILSALCLSIYLRTASNDKGFSWWFPVTADLKEHWMFPAGIGLLAVLFTISYNRLKHKNVNPKFVACVLVSVALSSLFAAWIASSLAVRLQHVLANLDLFVVVAVPATLLIICLSIALLVGLSSKVTEDEDREWLARGGGWLLVSAFGWLLLFGVGVLGPQIWLLVVSTSTAVGSGIALSMLGYHPQTGATGRGYTRSIQLPKEAHKDLRNLAIPLLLPVFVAFVLVALSQANHFLLGAFGPQIPRLGGDGVGSHERNTALALLLMELLISTGAAYWINVNKFSLHGMYKLRLIRAYLGASRREERKPNLFTGFDPEDNVHMAELLHRPFHVVNMTLNLVRGKRLSWQQRKAASFAASPCYVGSLWWGYRPVKHYSDADSGMSLGGAMTISGAAASPNMGYHSSSLLTIVMTLFNARLGAWLGNPGAGGEETWKENGPTFGWRSYFDELFGWTDESSNWVYLSDGGHFENLGIYEMVLRRCRTIIAIDASCDEHYKYEDLGNALRKVRIDLGIPIDFGLWLPGVGVGPNARHMAVADIRYSVLDKDTPDGVLIYVKASMTGDECPDIAQYKAAHPQFPHESTADQWFTEAQFESYRALGEHVISSTVTQSIPADTPLFAFARLADPEWAKKIAAVARNHTSW